MITRIWLCTDPTGDHQYVYVEDGDTPVLPKDLPKGAQLIWVAPPRRTWNAGDTVRYSDPEYQAETGLILFADDRDTLIEWATGRDRDLCNTKDLIRDGLEVVK